MPSTEIQPLATAATVEADDETSKETSTFMDSGTGTGLYDKRLASIQRRR